ANDQMVGKPIPARTQPRCTDDGKGQTREEGNLKPGLEPSPFDQPMDRDDQDPQKARVEEQGEGRPKKTARPDSREADDESQDQSARGDGEPPGAQVRANPGWEDALHGPLRKTVPMRDVSAGARA